MLKKTIVILLVTIFVLFAGSIIYSVVQPRPFSWHASYDPLSKQPFGTYVFFKQIEKFFPGERVRKLHEEDLNYYYRNELFDQDSTDEYGEYFEVVDSTLNMVEFDDPLDFNFIGINSFFDINNLDAKALLLHIYQGNHALIAAEGCSELLLKLLEIEYDYQSENNEEQLVELLENESDSLVIETVIDSIYQISYNKNLKIDLKRAIHDYSYISKYPQTAEIIASGNNDEVLGLKISMGKGSITIFTIPKLFTNYYLLKEDLNIVSKLVTDMPLTKTYWAKRVAGVRTYEEQRSIMDYIHSERALTWAFYTLVFGILVFLGLQIRRTERPVPIITDPENVSLNFIESVSALFVLHPNNKELIKKKMSYFLEMVREKYHLETNEINDQFIIKLSKKLKVKQTLLSHIFNIYNQAIKKQKVSNEEFLRFNKLMQTFKTNR
ncbi:MAG: hypothetical protein ABFS32_10200 [Bacteroidota bacterium]